MLSPADLRGVGQCVACMWQALHTPLSDFTLWDLSLGSLTGPGSSGSSLEPRRCPSINMYESTSIHRCSPDWSSVAM